VKAALEIFIIAILAGLILTAYDGAMVGEYRWQSPKLFVYSMASGALFFLFPYVVLAAIAFIIRLFAKNTWSATRTHRFALVVSAVIAVLLLIGGYYGSTHAVG